MILTDILLDYKINLEEKIAEIYYNLDNGFMSGDSLTKLGKYHRRLEMIDTILNKLGDVNKLSR